MIRISIGNFKNLMIYFFVRGCVSFVVIVIGNYFVYCIWYILVDFLMLLVEFIEFYWMGIGNNCGLLIIEYNLFILKKKEKVWIYL